MGRGTNQSFKKTLRMTSTLAGRKTKPPFFCQYNNFYHEVLLCPKPLFDIRSQLWSWPHYILVAFQNSENTSLLDCPGSKVIMVFETFEQNSDSANAFSVGVVLLRSSYTELCPLKMSLDTGGAIEQMCFLGALDKNFSPVLICVQK